jgi:arginase
MIHLIGAPFDLCGRRVGSALGPAALRLANILPELTRLDQTEDLGDIQFERSLAPGAGLRNFDAALSAYQNVKRTVSASLSLGAKPIVMGGDHSISIGSVSAALEATQGDLAVLWIDAHADLNVPGTSPSGNLHGMPLAALLGLRADGDTAADRQWQRLLESVVPATRLAPNRVGWIGLRDVDAPERNAIDQLEGSFATTMHDIDRYGIERVVDELHAWMGRNGASNIWISFDVDSLDPVLAPGTGTMVRGGLNYREGHLLSEMLHEKITGFSQPYRLLGLDIVEVNPVLDQANYTAINAVEWACSLFGKRILNRGTRAF